MIGEQTSDPGFLNQAINDLIATRDEFPIKPESARTTPYSAVLLESSPSEQAMLLKLFRPLPASLAAGTWFNLAFLALGQRYEGRIALVGPEGHLQYRFEWPRSLRSTDRRIWKRYGVQPLEKVRVTAQDNEKPCHGLTGELADLSLGGCLFRVERMVGLEDGLPVRLRPELFPPGKLLPKVLIQGLAKSDVLEARGLALRVEEDGSGLRLAIQFQGMRVADRTLLSRMIEALERQNARITDAGPAEGRADRLMAWTEAEQDAQAVPRPEDAGSETLRRLDRRTARILVIAWPGQDRDAVLRLFQAHGYWRLEAVPDLTSALKAFASPAGAPCRLLAVNLEPGLWEGIEAVEAVRQVEPTLRAFGDLPVAFVSAHPDPMLDLLDRPGLGVVALEDPDRERCHRVLDRLLAGS